MMCIMLLEENMHRLHSVPELRGLRLFHLVKRFVHQKFVLCLIQRGPCHYKSRDRDTTQNVLESGSWTVLFFIETHIPKIDFHSNFCWNHFVVSMFISPNISGTWNRGTHLYKLLYGCGLKYTGTSIRYTWLIWLYLKVKDSPRKNPQKVFIF